MIGLLKKLLSPKRTDSGKSLKQVVNEIQHTHDLQEVIELLNGLNEKERQGLWITIAVWDIPPRTIGDIEMIGNIEVIIEAMGRLFAPSIFDYPVRSIETYDSTDKAIGRLFDSICFNHMLLCAKYGETDYNQLILFVR